jgi:hypothetical protein
MAEFPLHLVRRKSQFVISHIKGRDSVTLISGAEEMSLYNFRSQNLFVTLVLKGTFVNKIRMESI